MENRRIKIKGKNFCNNFLLSTLIIIPKVDIYFNCYKGQQITKSTVNRKIKKKNSSQNT